MFQRTIITLAIRNVGRNLPRLRPMVVVLAVSFVLLFTANAILEPTNAAFYTAFARTVSGDYTISSTPASGESFTLFGSEAFLVGEFLVSPTLVDFPALQDLVDAQLEVAATAGLVSVLAQVQVAGVGESQPLFGVDFAQYSQVVIDLQLIQGSFPEPGEPGIMIHEQRYRSLVESGQVLDLGMPVLLTSTDGTSFTIREVPLRGVFRYPVRDELLDRVALIDADTARALNRYVYAARQSVVGDTQQALLDTAILDLFDSPDPADQPDEPGLTDELWDFEDLFAADDDLPADDQDAPPTTVPPAIVPPPSPAATGSLLDSVDQLFSGPEFDQQLTELSRTRDAAWNFLLIRLHEGASVGPLRRSLNAAGFAPENGFQLRDWRASIGGTVLIVWFLQLAINAGLLFVTAGAVSITMNAVVLSILERTREIGTMRALGARRAVVLRMVAIETIVVVVGSALIGVLLGIPASAVLNAAAIDPTNPLLRSLFGGSAIVAQPSLGLIAAHLAAALLLGAAAVIYPLKKALGISPLRAMESR